MSTLKLIGMFKQKKMWVSNPSTHERVRHEEQKLAFGPRPQFTIFHVRSILIQLHSSLILPVLGQSQDTIPSCISSGHGVTVAQLLLWILFRVEEGRARLRVDLV